MQEDFNVLRIHYVDEISQSAYSPGRNLYTFCAKLINVVRSKQDISRININCPYITSNSHRSESNAKAIVRTFYMYFYGVVRHPRHSQSTLEAPPHFRVLLWFISACFFLHNTRNKPGNMTRAKVGGVSPRATLHYDRNRSRQREREREEEKQY